ncbi:MAG: hypothetical protein J6B45_04490 [Clostridia bacterium]|nr:hypothetical protein [Clostridia bacterium]
MELKRLLIKNFGDIKELCYVPDDIMNCVDETVANAISYVLNNQFAIRHYNKIALRENTYLFGIIHHYEKGRKIVYTTEINGQNPPIFTKDGMVMTDDEVDNNQILSRPYREDNTCVFSARSKNEFLDYEKFLPAYFGRLTGYSSSFNTVIGNSLFVCNASKNYSITMGDGKPTVWKSISGRKIGLVKDLSECDKISAEYTTFVLISQMMDYHQQYGCKGRVITRTPVIVDGLISGLDKEPSNTRFLLRRTRGVARQAFFVEKDTYKAKRLMESLLNS